MTVQGDAFVNRLQRAAAVVQEANIPEVFWSSAFSKAFDALAVDEQGGGPVSQDEGDVLGPISRRIGLDVSSLARIYEVDDEGVHLLIGRSALNKHKAHAMREVAQLLIAARQSLGADQWTAVGDIRAVCEDRGVLDAANFATEIKKLDGDGFRFRGSGANRELKINQVGYEHVRDLITQLVGGTSE
jgi:hypothetical protein